MKMTLEELKNVVAEMESKNLTEIDLNVTIASDYGIIEAESIEFDIWTEKGYYVGTLCTLLNK